MGGGREREGERERGREGVGRDEWTQLSQSDVPDSFSSQGICQEEVRGTGLYGWT